MKNVKPKYHCPMCSTAFSEEIEAQDCFKKCKELLVEDAKRYENELAEATNKAIEWALNSGSIKLLIQHNYISDARKLCSDWMRHNIKDFGSSFTHEYILDKMIESIEKRKEI